MFSILIYQYTKGVVQNSSKIMFSKKIKPKILNFWRILFMIKIKIILLLFTDDTN